MPDDTYRYVLYGPQRSAQADAEEDMDRVVQLLREQAPDLLPPDLRPMKVAASGANWRDRG